MSYNAYDPCPCGSGKKLKFCCQPIASEMETVVRLQEKNQPRIALQHLDSAEKTLSKRDPDHPGLAWVRVSKAGMLLTQNDLPRAKELLEQVLQQRPDHAEATGMYALVKLWSEGYEQAKPAIERTFQHRTGHSALMVVNVAINVAGQMRWKGEPMLARQHLALAMTLAGEKEREKVFLRLLEVDGDSNVPYPLRGPHPLQRDCGDVAMQGDFKKALKLSDIGCFHTAAKKFGKLADQRPDNAFLWQNTALCQAWEGNSAGAAAALHRAAGLHEDFATSVECETIAQLLELTRPENRSELISAEYRVSSVARLLTLLDQHDRFVRLTPSQQEAEEPAFGILDRSPDIGPDVGGDEVPNMLGDLSIFSQDSEGEQIAYAVLHCDETEKLQKCIELLQEAAKEAIEPGDDRISENFDVYRLIPKELEALEPEWYFPADFPIVARERLEQQHWSHYVDEVWPNTALGSLGGQTPLQACGDVELRLPLTAALFVLDAYADQAGRMLDFESLRRRLDLPALQPLQVDEDTHLNLLSVMQLHRLPLSEISDTHLSHVMNRALLIHHSRFLYWCLTEALSRPNLVQGEDVERVYTTLAELALEKFDREEAYDWIDKGRAARGGTFQHELRWKLEELKWRTADPADPKLYALLSDLWNNYGPKLRKLREHLQLVVHSLGLTPPWESSGGLSSEAAGTTTPSGIWTPEKAGGEEKKLWLPGQD